MAGDSIIILSVIINVYKHLKFNFVVTSMEDIEILPLTYSHLTQNFKCFRTIVFF